MNKSRPTVPHWTDGCNHLTSNGVLVDTVPNSDEIWDVYLFPDRFHGVEVCLRYGSRGEQYLSPGSLMQFIRAGRKITDLDGTVHSYAAWYGTAIDAIKAFLETEEGTKWKEMMRP